MNIDNDKLITTLKNLLQHAGFKLHDAEKVFLTNIYDSYWVHKKTYTVSIDNELLSGTGLKFEHSSDLETDIIIKKPIDNSELEVIMAIALYNNAKEFSMPITKCIEWIKHQYKHELRNIKIDNLLKDEKVN